jgi:hypothetical protein
MIRVVLIDKGGEETILGKFNQGVVLDLNGDLIDVATKVSIAHKVMSLGSAWYAHEPYVDDPMKGYWQLFIQQIPLEEQRRLAWAELDRLVAERPHCPTVRCEEHEHCVKIDLARERVNYLGEPNDA